MMDNNQNSTATGTKVPEATKATSEPPATTGGENVIFASNLINSGSITNVVWINRSKSGIPCLWENGGGYTNTGRAQVITDNKGYPKRAICIRTHGDRACGNHALIPVRAGDHVVTVDRQRDKVAVRVERIESVNGNSAELVPEMASICVDAINAAIEKSYDYHCRDPYYVR